ncbi:hypothetical protein PROFUN_05703 [Planoprotostelium fungivorum]|uniref:Uncharacterized protein n=1 Tax=Planoprotostelium fungivorum TaxID=1890364 RepID=A0A2P6NQF3_9EUKA|nr:hypothetical protein PROFUN_05703 [Planoprotostelium fungivorum]
MVRVLLLDWTIKLLFWVTPRRSGHHRTPHLFLCIKSLSWLWAFYTSNVFHIEPGFLLLGMVPLVAAVGFLFYVAEPLHLEFRRLAGARRYGVLKNQDALELSYKLARTVSITPTKNMLTTLGGIRNAVLFIELFFVSHHRRSDEAFLTGRSFVL